MAQPPCGESRGGLPADMGGAGTADPQVPERRHECAVGPPRRRRSGVRFLATTSRSAQHVVGPSVSRSPTRHMGSRDAHQSAVDRRVGRAHRASGSQRPGAVRSGRAGSDPVGLQRRRPRRPRDRRRWRGPRVRRGRQRAVWLRHRTDRRRRPAVDAGHARGERRHQPAVGASTSVARSPPATSIATAMPTSRSACPATRKPRRGRIPGA